MERRGLIDPEAIINKEYSVRKELFFKALENGDKNTILFLALLNKDFLKEVSKRGESVLVTAAANGHESLIIRLVGLGAKISSEEERNEILSYCQQYNMTNVLLRLVKNQKVI